MHETSRAQKVNTKLMLHKEMSVVVIPERQGGIYVMTMLRDQVFSSKSFRSYTRICNMYKKSFNSMRRKQLKIGVREERCSITCRLKSGRNIEDA